MSGEDVERYFEGLFGVDGNPSPWNDVVTTEYDALLRGELPENDAVAGGISVEEPWENEELAGGLGPGIPLACEAQIRSFPLSQRVLDSFSRRGVRYLTDLLSTDISRIPFTSEQERLELIRYMLSRSRRISVAPSWARTWRFETSKGSVLFFFDWAGTLCCAAERPGLDASMENREVPYSYEKAVDSAVSFVVEHGCRIYEPSFRAWLESRSNLADGCLTPAEIMDALTLTGDAAETLELGCECAIATWYDDQVNLGLASGSHWSYRFPNAAWWIHAANSFAEKRPSLSVDDVGHVIRFRTVTLDEFLSELHSPSFSPLRLYLDGKTFKEAGEALCLSHERTRQLVREALDCVPPLKEDALMPLMERYSVSRDQFAQIVGEDERVYNYLKLRCGRVVKREPLKAAVSDVEIPDEIRNRIRTFLNGHPRRSGGVAENLATVWRRLRKDRGTIECSARLAFELYPDLMELIGARDEFELFELSKRLLPKRTRIVQFGPEIPIVRLGYCSGTAQIYRVIKRLEPVAADDLFEEYYRLYRVDRELFSKRLEQLASYQSEDGMYHAARRA